MATVNPRAKATEILLDLYADVMSESKEVPEHMVDIRMNIASRLSVLGNDPVEVENEPQPRTPDDPAPRNITQRLGGLR